MMNGSVVITGASSGIGLATSKAFARRGADLVLCARGEQALDEAVQACRSLGARAIAVPTDTRDAEAVRRLAAMAAETFGGIDVWVNNAGGGVVGRFWEVPIEAHRETIEIDLLGYVHGAHAALPHFLAQGHGVLINNISIGGLIATPYAAAYAAAKAGVRAFAHSLRQELAPWPSIHVCSVYPYFVDTPGVQHAANYTGRKLQPAPFTCSPETVADTIVGLVDRPRREVVVGVMGKLARLQHLIAPRLVEAALGRGMATYFRHAAPARSGSGNLFEASSGPMTEHGGWAGSPVSTAVLAAAGVAVGGTLALWARQRRDHG